MRRLAVFSILALLLGIAAIVMMFFDYESPVVVALVAVMCAILGIKE